MSVTAGVPVYEGERVAVATADARRYHFHWQPLSLAGILCFTVSVNVWWISAHRPGLPFDIDEAGYLQRAVRDAQTLHAHGLGGVWSILRIPDPQAPLLPLTAGVVRWLSGAGTYRLLDLQQIFYVATVVATYWAARSIMNRNWSLVAAVMVAAVPGLVENSRGFNVPLVAAATLTGALAVQLHSDAFRSWRLSLLWGVLLALASLSRTIVLALLPGLVLAAVFMLIATRASHRQIAQFVAALSLGVLIAGLWYSATWHLVVRYLTSYGYGSEATHYGTSRSVLSLGWWTYRLHLAVDTEVFAPLAFAVLLCLLCGVVAWWMRRGVQPDTGGWRGKTIRFFGRPESVVAIFVVWGYLVLSTTANQGYMFELPLVPAFLVLVAAVVARTKRRLRPYLATVCVFVAAISFAGTSDALPGVPSAIQSVSVGSLSLTAFDGRNALVYFSSIPGGPCGPEAPCVRSGTTLAETSYLAKWLAPSQRMATLLQATADRHGCDPVVFFAVEDPLFNTNTVDLDYQLTYSASLPTGLLEARDQAPESPTRQLDDPDLGDPNLVITGTVPAASPGFVFAGYRSALKAVRSNGFVPAASLRLPDGRVMTVWWKNRGSCVLSTPSPPLRTG